MQILQSTTEFQQWGETPQSDITAGIKLRPLPASTKVIAALDGDAEMLFTELCFYFEPDQGYVHLPFHLQQQIDNREFCGAIARLQVKGLVEVAIGG